MRSLRSMESAFLLALGVCNVCYNLNVGKSFGTSSTVSKNALQQFSPMIHKNIPTKVALLADIHGNSPALQAVLKDIQHNECSQVFVLGDIINGVDPHGCIELLQ